MSTIVQNKVLIQRWNRDFIQTKNLGVFHELVAPSFVNHAAPAGKQGFADTLHFFEGVLWPALTAITIEILDQVGEGDKIVTHKVLRGILEKDFMGFPATHAAVAIEVIDIFRIEEGKLAEHWGMVKH
jgi:predicted SnoaL-like aldol condensation-catalyzing enzyme